MLGQGVLGNLIEEAVPIVRVKRPFLLLRIVFVGHRVSEGTLAVIMHHFLQRLGWHYLCRAQVTANLFHLVEGCGIVLGNDHGSLHPIAI